MSKGNREDFSNGERLQIIMYIIGCVLALTIIALIVVFMLDNSNNKADLSIMELGEASNLVPNLDNSFAQQVSNSGDKTVEESKNEVMKVVINEDNKNDLPSENVNEEESNVKLSTKETGDEKLEQDSVETASVDKNETEESEGVINDKTQEETNTKENDQKIEFIAPVSGDIIRDYAEDTLVYSETLDEWTTHFGIDIEAKKTTAVKASADGIVESKKNDPRYGLTVTISHENGMKTIYSNLLTAEYISEGDSVKQGQTIGTVGESAAFEILDSNHLHFEMLKDGKNVNPTIYLK